MNKSVLLFSLFLVFSGCDPNNDCYTVPTLATYTIQIQVTGTATAVDILLVVEDSLSDTTRIEDTLLPWSKELLKEGDTWVYLAAQNQDSLGTVTTTLLVNDSILVQNSKSGPTAIPSLSYTILGEDYTVNILKCP